MPNDGPSDNDVWFEQKRFGYGAGLPVAWQGWALLGAYIALLVGMNFLLRPQHPVAFFVIAGVATVALAIITARHTRGGWRWRW